MTVRTRGLPRWLLMAAFGLGLAIRLVLLMNTKGLDPQIVDEQQYCQIAGNVASGDGFGWAPGALTSIRPPLFPGLVAGIWKATGSRSLQAVRIVNVLLSLSTAVILFLLGSDLFGQRIAAISALTFWLCPSFILYDFLILTETLFTFLLVLFVFLLTRTVRTGRFTTAFGCGVALGLAALTRSVLWPLPVILCPSLLLMAEGGWIRRSTIAALVLAGYATVVMPWAIRNTRLQGVPEVIDTMGGLNLRMGNYEYTPDDRMWAAVDLPGEQNWAYPLFRAFPTRTFTEGEKDKWAQHEAFAYMKAHPATTARRSLIKLADLVGLEREFVAGVQQGLYAPPRWFAVIAGLALVLAFPLIALTGVAGVWLALPSIRQHTLVLLPLLTIIAGHVLAFGHSRYHLPLVPFLILYGVAFVVEARGRWQSANGFQRFAVGASVSFLLGAWGREVLIVDADRIHALLSRLL